jgi:hypothetical protein
MKFWTGIFCILILVSVDSAFAYLDPGTGSMLLQVILGGVAAVGVAVKLYWHKIRVALRLSRKTDTEDETE